MANTKNKEQENANLENIKVEVKKAKKPITIPEDTLIDVQSGFYGTLYYRNSNSGEQFIWNGIGEIQTLPLRELRMMKNQQVGFYKNQWIIIKGVNSADDCKATVEEICKALGVSHFYANYIDPTNLSVVCDWEASEIKDRVKLLSASAKENLIVALNEFIKDGKFDSIRKKKLFEEALDCELCNID